MTLDEDFHFVRRIGNRVYILRSAFLEEVYHNRVLPERIDSVVSEINVLRARGSTIPWDKVRKPAGRPQFLCEM